MTGNKMADVLLRGLASKSIGTRESGFFSRWGWSLESWSGHRVTQQIALQNDTAWACTRKITNAVAGLPFGLYSRQQDGGRKLATDHPLYDLLHNEPNPRMSAFSYWQMAVASMVLWGNAYTEITRTGSGRVANLSPLPPDRVRVDRDDRGRLTYEFFGLDGRSRPIARENIMHVKAFTLDGEIGISAIQYGYNSIGSALAADKAADETFRDASRASGIVTMDSVLKKDQRDDIREHVKEVAKGGGVYVLEKGAGYESLKFNPHDAELLNSRTFSVETICRWFEMPPVMVGHGDKQSSWPTSTEAQGALFLRYVLRSYILCIEQEIHRSLLTPAERLRYFGEFALEGLLRGDSAARSAFYSTALQNGWMSRNEVRRLENLPPIDGGDVMTVQSNLLPLEQLGKAPAADQTQVRDALKAWLGLVSEKGNEHAPQE